MARVDGWSAAHFGRLGLVAALIVAFGVAGCGRKGPLDPPPMEEPASAGAPPELPPEDILEEQP